MQSIRRFALLLTLLSVTAIAGCSTSEDDGLVSGWGRAGPLDDVSDEPPAPFLNIDLTSRTITGHEFGFEPLKVTLSLWPTPCAEVDPTSTPLEQTTFAVTEGAQPGRIVDAPLPDGARCIRTGTDQDLPWAELEFDMPTEGWCDAGVDDDTVTGAMVGMGAIDVHAFTDGSAGPQRIVAERTTRTADDGSFATTLEAIVAGAPEGQPISADSPRLDGDLDIIATDEIGVVADATSRYSRFTLRCTVG